MRADSRIDNICQQLAQLWHQLPDWRLAQLMSNVFFTKDCFYMEDQDFIDYIERFIKEVKGE